MVKRNMPPTDMETIAYMIGVPQTEIADVYDRLQVKPYIQVRKLCSLRSAIMLNYVEVKEALLRGTPLHEIQKLSRICEDIAKSDMVVEGGRPLAEIVVTLNRMITEYVEEVFAEKEWANATVAPWMLKALFLMPAGNTTDGVKAGLEKYQRLIDMYPYQKYINWDFTVSCDAVTLLTNTKKFLNALKKVSSPNPKSETLNEFLSEAKKTVLMADCENSDPMKLYTLIINAERKINKVILIDDSHTTMLWQWVESHLQEAGICVDRVVVERIKEQKSLVDLIMATRTTKEFYQNGIDSFLLATSDSDIWALITSLPDARFMLLSEGEKCGEALIKALAQREIPTLFLEEITNGEENTLLNQITRSIAEDVAAKWCFDARKAVYSAAQQLSVTMTSDEITRCAVEVVSRLGIQKDGYIITLAPIF